VRKFQRKILKTPFVVYCQKSLCCQKTHFGPLGVNDQFHEIVVTDFCTKMRCKQKCAKIQKRIKAF